MSKEKIILDKFIQRFSELISESSFEVPEVAKMLDISVATAYRYQKGESVPKIPFVKCASELFNVNPLWLMGYDVLKEKKQSNGKEKNIYLCPIYGKIAAGEPNWAEECLDGYLPVQPKIMNIMSPEECFFLRVNGESMNKVIKNGAFALIRRTDFVENGEIAVVLVNGYDATLKKFTKKDDVIVLEPMSDDPSFTTQVYTKETPIKVIGKYLGKFEMN